MPDDVIKIGVTDGKELGSENRLLLIFTQTNKNLSVQNLDSAILERPGTIALRGCRNPFNNDFLPDDEDLMDHLDEETWSYDLIRFTIS